MENKDKEIRVPKWVLINRPKIPQMPQNLSAQIVCPSPKVWDFDEKRLHWMGVRSPCIQSFLQACVKRWTKMLLYIKNFPLFNKLFRTFKAIRPQGHKGSFNNYVEIDLPLFDHPLPTSMWTFFTLIVDQNGPFMDHLSSKYTTHLVHVRSYWTAHSRL